MKETYAESAQVSRSDWIGGRGRDRLVHRYGPFHVRRFNPEVERTGILVDVHRIATDTSMVDRQDEGTPADIAIDGDLKDALPGSHLVSGFPLQAKGAGIADERFGGYRTVAGPGPELPPGLYLSCGGLWLAAARLEEEAEGCCHNDLGTEQSDS
jgi:hypothetical protein